VHAVGLLRLVVLAKLLGPDDFGLFGIALVILSSLDNLSRVGLDVALLQREGDPRGFLDTVFVALAARGLLLGGMLIALAGPAAAWWGEPEVVALLVTIGGATMISGLGNPGMLLVTREFDFRTRFRNEFPAGVADAVVAVAAAWVTRDPMALAYGLFARNAVMVATSYALHPYRPRLRFERARAAELFGFGRHVLVQRFTGFLLLEGDDLLVSKLVGSTALGLYRMAYRLANLVATEVANVAAQITFLAFARLQTDRERVGRGTVATLRITTLVNAIVSATLFVYAEPLTYWALSAEWLPLVPALRILCVFGFVRAAGIPFEAVFMGLGRAGVQSRILAAQLVLAFAMAVPATLRFGIEGTAAAMTLAMVIATIAQARYGLRILSMPWRALAAPLGIPLVAAAAATAGPRWLLVGPGPGTLAGVGVAVVASALLYGALCAGLLRALDPRGWDELRALTALGLRRQS